MMTRFLFDSKQRMQSEVDMLINKCNKIQPCQFKMLLRNIRAKSEPFVTKIIIDTHGGLEDVIAIMHSIKFAKFNKMEIIGITVTNGRRTLEEATTDALLAVVLSGASIPIYKGIFCPIQDPIKQ